MALAALAKQGLLRTHLNRHSLPHCSWKKRSFIHSTPDPFATRSSRIDRFSPLRKDKDVQVTSNFSVSFSSRASSSPSSSKKSGLLGWYLAMVKARPIATKSITATLIYTAADVSSQMVVGEQYDLMRTVRMAGYGMLVLGPSIHYWYNFMARLFPKRDVLSTFKKMALGQTTYGPAMTAIFFSLNAALQGESGSEIVARLKRDLLPTMVNGVKYWPICDFVTFKFIPVHLQPLVTNSFSYLWTVYMTYMASLAKVGSD